jgi:HK97 family phage prohead protease
MERKSFKFELKEADAETGTFTGYAATFTDKPDAYGDVIEKGAFKKTLKEMGKRVKVLWNHDPKEVIGKPLEITEDEKGLLVHGKLSLGVQRAREVFELMKDGVINEMSIGYETITEKREEWGKQGVRILKEVKLWDVSPVTFAANPDAGILSVKNLETKLDELEQEIKENKNIPVVKIKAAIGALQALIEDAEIIDLTEDNSEKSETPALPVDTEPSSDTLNDDEAAIDRTLLKLRGFDEKKAEARIDQILAKIRSN